MLDLNALLGQLTNSAAQRQQNVVSQLETMNADTAAMQEMMTVNTQEATQVAQTSADLAARTAAVEYVRNKTMENAQAVLGLNPDDVNNQLATSMAEYNAAETQRKASKQQFDKLSQISLLDNPLGWLAAQLQLPQVAAQNNAAVDARDAAAANITTRQQLLTAHRSAVTANTAAQVQQIKLDTAQNDLAAARIKIREAEIQNSSTIAGRKLQAYQLSDKLFDIESDLINKQLAVGQYMMSLEERREARAERAAQAAERLAALKDKNEAAALQDAGLLRVSQVLGLKIPVTTATLKYQKNPEAWIKAAHTGTLGADLIESVKFITADGNFNALRVSNPGLATAAQSMLSGIDSYESLARKELQTANMGKTPNNKEVIAKAQEMYMDEVHNSAAKPGSAQSLLSSRFDGSDRGGVFNPYKAQHKVIVDEASSSSTHPLRTNKYLEIITQAANSPQNKNFSNISGEEEKRALTAMSELVKTGKIPASKAAEDIASYYRYSMAKNLNLYQYSLFNIEPQARYFATISGVGAVDLADPMQVKKMIVSQATNVGALKRAATFLLDPEGKLQGMIAAEQGLNVSPTVRDAIK